MAFVVLGVALVIGRRWLYQRPHAFGLVETLFWSGCVLFVGIILIALLLQVLLTP